MKLRKRATGLLGAAVAVCVLAAACSPQAPPPVAPPPSPVARATPPETALERQTRLDFEAAEKSYRAFNAEYARVARAGGTRRATPTMRQYAAGPYLKAMLGFSTAAKINGEKSLGDVRVAYVRPGSYATDQLTLAACEDGTRVKNVNDAGELVGRGVAVELVLEFRRLNGRWIIWNGDDSRVASCSA